jgi:hypothetical protein
MRRHVVRHRRTSIPVLPTDTGVTRVPLIPLQNVDFLLGQSYDVRVTRLDRTPWGLSPGQESQPRTGPIVTTEIPFTLVGGAVAIVIASSDPERTGLSLQNGDPVANLFYSFGRLADATSRFLTPGMVLLRDFNTPTDRISVFSLVNVSGILATEARLA